MRRIRIEEEEKLNNDLAKYKSEHSADLILAKKKTAYINDIKTELKTIKDIYKGICKNLESFIDPGELVGRK
eukprot:UN01888